MGQLGFADGVGALPSQAGGPPACGAQLAFDMDSVSLRETTFVVVDLETTGGRASGEGHDAITEIGAVKVRGGAVLGELATLVDPGRSIPPQIVALTGITSAMVYNAPTDRLGIARVPGVLPRRGASRPQRRLRHRVPARGRRTLPDHLAAATGAVHGPAGPPGAHPRRGPERAAVRAGAVVRRGHHTDAPGARRRPRHGRRAARADRAGRQPGCAHLHRSAVVSARCDAGAAAQPAPRHWATASAGRLPVPGTVSRGVVRRNGGRSAQTGRPVLQRRRPAHPHQGDGVAGDRGRPRRVRARPRGRRARAAAARRPRAAVQPPLEVSAPLVVGGSHGRSVSAVFRGASTAIRHRGASTAIRHRGARPQNSTTRLDRSVPEPTPWKRPRCWRGSRACGRAPRG